jgi:hypothetical protein
MNKKLILEVGKKFGKWTVISDETIRKNNLTHWKCKCQCGAEEFVPLNNLMNGNSTQCRTCASKKSGMKRRTGVGLITGDYWSQIKNNARRKNLPFEIRIEEAWDKYNEQESRCALTDRKICLTGYPYCKEKTTAVLSLLEPSKGFIKDNIVWLHKDVEHIKRDLSLDKLYELAKEIARA